MKKAFDKDSRERQFFADLWDICQKYWIPDASKDYWNEVIKATDELNEKYRDIHPAVPEIIVGFICGLEKKSKEIDLNENEIKH